MVRSILDADFLSSYSCFARPCNKSDCELILPLSVDKELVESTRKYFGTVISTVKRGLNVQRKRRFPECYEMREDILQYLECDLFFDNRVITPLHIYEVLDGLHSVHLGAFILYPVLVECVKLS